MAQGEGFERLADELEERFGRGVEATWDERVFERLALEAFQVQFDRIPAYRAFCEHRGKTPSTVARWQDVPPVPGRAFKHLDLAVADAEAVFLTSGTTRGVEARGRHLVPRASLYRASLLPMFERYVLGDLPGRRIPFLSLIPSPDRLPTSSLSFMVGAASDALASDVHWIVEPDGGLDEDRLCAAMRQAVRNEEPILLLGTALAFLHMIERLEGDPSGALPQGSRIMETGGFKGLDRDVSRQELYSRLSAVTGVPAGRIVSEYGMTELLSQLYTPVLEEGTGATGAHVPPPWLKVRALDPITLDEVAAGESGLLAFFDLANAGSVCHVLTEDFGALSGGRVRLEGRLLGAEPRGCSRAMDELLSNAGRVG
jgi:hypothetical protein